MKIEYGYLGGGYIYNIGSRDYISSFFTCIEKYILPEDIYKNVDWTLVTDRLYKRVLDDKNIDNTIGVLSRLLIALEDILVSNIDIDEINPNVESYFQDKKNLKDVYFKIQDALSHCALGIFYNKSIGIEYPPLRIGCTYSGRNVVDGRRSVEEYEALGPNDLPFWLRDDIEYPQIETIVMDGGEKR